MTKAQCYYEILGVEETATGDEIKKAYRNLALVWHPDKNHSNPDAHAKFQTILKAYETLSDSRERDWYDRHKDQILSGGDGKEDANCVNLFQYFSSSCYANFDDSEDGFYTVYRKVFEEIAKEEEQAIKLAAKLSNKKQSYKTNDATEFPTFGNSKSEYDDVVRPFYAFWSGFCTRLTFDHLDKYNTTEAENRRILKAMERENKKGKDDARKERTTEVRNLVEFIKKRDKRLKAHKLIVEQRNQMNREKTAEKQRQQREKLQKEKAEYKPTAWEDMNDIEEQLRQLENEYDAQENKRSKNRKFEESFESSDENHDGEEGEDANDVEEVISCQEEEVEEEEEPDFYCPACSKDFKSIKAFENHEASRKHKQNVLKLTKLLKEEENKLNK